MMFPRSRLSFVSGKRGGGVAAPDARVVAAVNFISQPSL